MSRLILAAAVLFTLTSSLHADVLVLANSDRLSGTLVHEDETTIVFESPVLGLLTVPRETAQVERANAALAGVDVAHTALAPIVIPAEKPRPLDANYKFKPLDVRAAATDPTKALKAERTNWVRRMEFGFTSQSGRSEKADLALNFEAGRRGKRSEARFLARYLYGESNDEQTSDLLESSLRLRRNLSENTFAQSSTRASRDLIKEIDFDGEQGFGLGRNVLRTETTVLAFGAGAAARYRDDSAENSTWDYLVDCFQDLRYELNSRLSIEQDLSVVLAPANRDDYKLRLNTALTGKVTERFNMTMRYEYEYDRSLEADLRDNQRIVTALVYVF